jgi:hypothetical protein
MAIGILLKFRFCLRKGPSVVFRQPGNPGRPFGFEPQTTGNGLDEKQTTPYTYYVKTSRPI